MQFFIKKKYLYSKLFLLSRITTKYSPLPILSNIKFIIKKKKILLFASDGNISIIKKISKNNKNKLVIKKEGSFLIESKFILNILQKLDEKIVNFKIEDGNLINIYTSKIKFQINSSDIKIYPKIYFKKTKNNFYIKKKKLLKIIHQVSFVCTTNEENPVFSGINFKTYKKKISIITTDSFRIAKKIISLKINKKINFSIPSSTLYEVAKIFNDKKILISISENFIQFYNKNTLLQSQLIDGLFPEVNHLIPKNFLIKILLKKKDIIDAIDRTSILKNKIFWNVIFETFNNKIFISSKTKEIGTVKEVFSLINIDNKKKKFKICFNGKFVLEALKSLKSSIVEFSFINDEKPFMIKEKDNKTFFHLILPTRIIE